MNDTKKYYPNGKLHYIYSSLSMLDDLVIDGKHAISVVGFKNKVGDMLDALEIKHKGIIHDWCMMNDKGEPVKEKKKVKGEDVWEYIFESTEKQEKCSEIIKGLMNEMSDVGVLDIPKEYLETLKCKVEQMELLLTLNNV
jgi:hypothetical protein